MHRVSAVVVVCFICSVQMLSAVQWETVEVTVKDVTESNIKKQSTNEMPENVHVRVSGSGSDVDLRLKRSTETSSDLPIYVIKNGSAQRMDLPPLRDAANYIDVNGRSSMIIRRKENGLFNLDGMFLQNFTENQLISNDTGSYIKPGEIDYNNDYVVKSDLDNIASKPLRVRRQAGLGHIVEVLFVADYRDYSKFLERNKNDKKLTQTEMKLFYSFIADSIRLRYKTLTDGPNGDPQLKVTPLVTGLLILDNPAKSYFTVKAAVSNKLVANKALDAFNDWVKQQRGLPPSDHWMLYTGYNLVRSDGTQSVAGLAVVRSVCSRSAVSVVEQSYSGSIGATAAHELAHSLGAVHDEEDFNCHEQDLRYYIMSQKLSFPRTESMASRPWQFSKCSVKRIKNFLNRVTCTLKHNFLRSAIRTPTGIYPGQIYTADSQCKMELGKESYFSEYVQNIKGMDTMCRIMFCSVPGSKSSYRGVLPLEQTSCGQGKWCERGRCVSITHSTKPGAIDPEIIRTTAAPQTTRKTTRMTTWRHNVPTTTQANKDQNWDIFDRLWNMLFSSRNRREKSFVNRTGTTTSTTTTPPPPPPPARHPTSSDAFWNDRFPGFNGGPVGVSWRRRFSGRNSGPFETTSVQNVRDVSRADILNRIFGNVGPTLATSRRWMQQPVRPVHFTVRSSGPFPTGPFNPARRWMIQRCIANIPGRISW